MSIYRTLITVGGSVLGGGVAYLVAGPLYPGAAWVAAGALLMVFTAVQVPPKLKPAGK